MELNTVHFGVMEIDEADFIEFPEGIPGFEETRKYALIGYEANETPFFWLQSVERQELCFVVTDPFLVYDNYGVDVSDDDVKLLGIADTNTVMTLAIVVIPEDIKETRVNLKAPILINVDKKLGKQVIQRNENLPVRYFLNKN